MDDPTQARPQQPQDSPVTSAPDPAMQVATDDPNAYAYTPPAMPAPPVSPSLDGRADWSHTEEVGPTDQTQETPEASYPAAPSHSPERMAGTHVPEQPGAHPEIVSYIEHTDPEISPELSEFIQKEEIQHETIDMPIVIHEHNHNQGAPGLQLPLSKASAQQGLNKGVGSSIRWLSEWCFRMFKKVSGKVVFLEDDPKPPQV